MRARIRVAITVAAVAAGTALFIGTPGAVAIQSQPVLAGAQNTANFETLIVNTSKVSLNTCLALNPNVDSGLVACGHHGVQGVGSGNGNGVEGWSITGDGVFGTNTGSTGIGVHGKTSGVGSAVFGEATANGVGVFGKSTNGIGVIAQTDATNGTALKATALNGRQATAVSGVTDSGVAGRFYSPGSSGWGVLAQGGDVGVYGQGFSSGDGVVGHANTTGTGVVGSSETGDGVFGANTGLTGIGVHGKTGGVGSAVFGEATVNGAGVYGKSQSGSALRGDSPNGTALEVNGKAKFSRSGIVVIAAGTASKAVGLAGVTGASMVVATAQQNGSVFVKAAVPAGGSFTIFLNGNAPVGGLKVAYFVLN